VNHSRSNAVAHSILKVAPAQSGDTMAPSTSRMQEEQSQSSKQTNTEKETAIGVLNGQENDGKAGIAPDVNHGNKQKAKRVTFVNTKTSTMLFICTSIYIVTWIPFFLDIFLIMDSLSLRYLCIQSDRVRNCQ
jgi:hypothetical protein